MGSDVGQIFPTASLHRDHSISYALVCEKELSHMGKINGSPHLVCENIWYGRVAWIIESPHDIFNTVVCATSKASDQPAHMYSLIRAFASCLNIL